MGLHPFTHGIIFARGGEMFKISDEKKEEFWTALAAERRPPRLTETRLRKLKALMWDDGFFWDDVVARHGGLQMSVQELKASDPAVYDHCLGNFHGMLCEELWRRWRVA